MVLENLNIYRLTHIDNIPHIKQYGITNQNSKYLNPNYKSIGDISLINLRKNKTVCITNGGTKILKRINLGDYIPFYFGVKMPMLYVIQQGGNFVPKAIKAEDIIYLVCSVKKIYDLGYDFYFSDGHATDILTTFYNREEIVDFNNIIDWNSVKASYWGGENNLDVKRKKQAEFLVKDDIHPQCIIGYGCYNENAFNKLVSFEINSKLIKIIPNKYF